MNDNKEENNGLHEECQNCFELHKLDCCGVGKKKELTCYLYKNKEK